MTPPDSKTLLPTSSNDFHSIQSRIEYEAVHTGIYAYRARQQRFKAKQIESMSDPAMYLVKKLVDPLSRGVVDFITESRAKPGRKSTVAPYLEQCDPDVVSLLTIRTILDSLHSAPTYQNVSAAIGKAVEDELRAAAFEDQKPQLWSKLRKYVDEHPLAYRPGYKANVLAHAARKYQIVWQPWDQETRIRIGGLMIDLCIQHTGLVDTDIVGNRATGKAIRLKKVVVPTPKLEEWLTNAHMKCELLHPQMLPMVIPPNPWHGLKDGGYSHPKLKYTLISGNPNQFVSEVNDRTMPLVYRMVNAVQAIQWKINTEVLDTLVSMWGQGVPIPGACRRDDLPLPPKPPRDSKGFKAYKVKAREIYKENIAQAGKRLATSMLLSIATRYRDWPMYFTPRLDFRGRMYIRQQYLNPQGTDVSKGLLLFAEPKPLGEDGLRWLKIHTANCWGVDKVSFEERIAWVDEHIAEIAKVADDPLSNRWWTEAEEAPIQFLAACLDLTRALRSLDPTTYASCLPIHLDGSCNGIQHLAALSRDLAAGSQVNLIPSPKPSRIYSTVAKETQRCLEILRRPLLTRGRSLASSPSSPSDASSSARGCRTGTQEGITECFSSSSPSPAKSLNSPPSPSSSSPSTSGTWLAELPGLSLGKLTPEDAAELSQLWLTYGVSDSLSKRPTMIYSYNGTLAAVEKYTDEYLRTREREGTPHPFGERRNLAIRFLSLVIWYAINRTVEGPRQIMDMTRAVSREVTEAGVPLYWTLPSGFRVKQVRYQIVGRSINLRTSGERVQLIIAEQTDRLDKRKQGQALAPNWIHSLDAAHLCLTVNALLDLGVTVFSFIHDSYGTRAGDVSLLAQTLRETFVKMYQEDLIVRFLEDVSKSIGRDKMPEPPKRGELKIEDVLRSDYFFS